MHSKECIALGQSNPELFSAAYRSRMNIGDHAPPAPVAATPTPPPPGGCSHADHAHGRNGC
jgi:hypothetical protein